MLKNELCSSPLKLSFFSFKFLVNLFIWFISRSFVVILGMFSLSLSLTHKKREREREGEGEGDREKRRVSMRFQFYVKVYYHKLFTSSNLLFQLEDRVSRKRHFSAVRRQVGSQKSNGTVYRILRKQMLQSESLVRIRTSRSLPKEGDPSWVEGFVHSTQCLFISRPEERCSADCPYFGLARLVPRRKLVSFLFYVLYIFLFLFFDETRIVDT